MPLSNAERSARARDKKKREDPNYNKTEAARKVKSRAKVTGEMSKVDIDKRQAVSNDGVSNTKNTATVVQDTWRTLLI